MAISSALRLMRPLGGQALQLDGETADVDAVANRESLVGGVGQLQKIRHVIQDAFFGEGKVLFQNVVLLVAFGKVDEDLGLEPGVYVLGQLRRWRRRRSWWRPAGNGDGL